MNFDRRDLSFRARVSKNQTHRAYLTAKSDMKLTLPISPQSTSPIREAGVFAGLTIALTWLFWLPGAFLPGALGTLLLGIGSFAPLGVAIFLQVWLQKFTLRPQAWLKTLTWRAVTVAALTPLFVLMPAMMLRFSQSTLDIDKLFGDARGMWLGLIGLLIVSAAEEIGWRGYLLPRLASLPVPLTNLMVGFLWFVWTLPIIFAGRYNESENFGDFFAAMFLYSMLITPFFNRLARRGNYNPLLSAILRAGLQFVIAVYFLQGRADPLADTFGNLTIGWLFILNLVLFSQLWQDKKPPTEISELERVMPLDATS